MNRLTLALMAAAFVFAGCSKSGTVTVPLPQPQPSEVELPSESEAEGPSTAARLGIPPGHLPPPGKCRIWIPGRPPGHQGPKGDCSRLASQVPPDAWLVYRPSKDKKQVKVTVYHGANPGVISAVRWFEVASGKLLREEKR